MTFTPLKASDLTGSEPLVVAYIKATLDDVGRKDVMALGEWTQAHPGESIQTFYAEHPDIAQAVNQGNSKTNKEFSPDQLKEIQKYYQGADATRIAELGDLANREFNVDNRLADVRIVGGIVDAIPTPPTLLAGTALQIAGDAYNAARPTEFNGQNHVRRLASVVEDLVGLIPFGGPFIRTAQSIINSPAADIVKAVSAPVIDGDGCSVAKQLGAKCLPSFTSAMEDVHGTGGTPDKNAPTSPPVPHAVSPRQKS